MKNKIEIPKDSHGDECWHCKDLFEEGKDREDIENEHQNCHGWFHCGNECCGECMTCGR